MIAPILDEIAADHPGKLQIAKLNIDENLDLARRFEVMSIPTLILFKDGEPSCGSSAPRARVSCSKSSRHSCSGQRPASASGESGRVGPGSPGSSAAPSATTRSETGAGRFEAVTEQAVRSFQRERGLRCDGVCGEQTWSALVEAGLDSATGSCTTSAPCCAATTSPTCNAASARSGSMPAGSTASSVARPHCPARFPAQLRPPVDDGILGPETLRMLLRVSAQGGRTGVVAEVRERQRLREAPRTLIGRRVVVGETGGLAALADTVRRALVRAGCAVVLHDPDESKQAARPTG